MAGFPLIADAARTEVRSAFAETHEHSGTLRAIRVTVWVVALIVAFSQAWASRNNINSDGVSYLEMADALAHGNAGEVINGYWSPLYPVVIASALAVVHPSPENEAATMHAVNAGLFLFAFVCFEFLLRGIAKARRDSERRLPDWFFHLVAYVIFIWASLYFITVTVTSPDMLLASFVFLASGVLVRIANGAADVKHFIALGLALGVGYWAKAPMFPLSLVFLGVAAVHAFKARSVGRIAAAVVPFVIVAGSLVLLLSASKGRLTFGESGRLNYAWYVDGAAYRHWQGEPLGAVHSDVAPAWSGAPASTGTPVHPTRKVLENPPVYEFAGPVSGTYPVWRDPSYWNEGLRGAVDLKQQTKKLISNARFYYSLLVNPHFMDLIESGHAYMVFSPLLVLCGIALLVLDARPDTSKLWTIGLPVVVPAVAAMGMYLVVYSEPRHLASFITLIYVGCLGLLKFPVRPASGIALKLVAAAIVLSFFSTTMSGSIRLVSNAAAAQTPEEWTVARGFHDLGFADGTKIAALCYSNLDHTKWARIARAKIVAEVFLGAYVLDEKAYWDADASTQAKVLESFAKAGAEAVVSRKVPQNPPAGWQRIGETQYFVLRLPHV